MEKPEASGRCGEKVNGERLNFKRRMPRKETVSWKRNQRGSTNLLKNTES
jgi:hypothetical protein